jgi:CHAT domain-containing protein/Flp pilus assembly protein TadD
MNLGREKRLQNGLLALLLASVLAGTQVFSQDRAPLTPTQQRADDEGRRLYVEAAKLRDEGRYSEAVSVVQRIQEIDENAFGADHSLVALDLNNLGDLYVKMGDFAQAVKALERALDIRIRRPESHALASIHNNLAAVYVDMGDYQRAEALYLRALEVNAKTFGRDSSEDAPSLQGLAVLYSKMGEYKKAEPLYLRALHIVKEAKGEKHLYVAITLSSLAGIYRNTGDYKKAEPLYLEALDIFSKQLRPDHPVIGTALNNLALMYHLQGDYGKAEPLYQRALEITEAALGKNHSEVAIDLNNLAALYQATESDDRALTTFSRSLEIQQKNLMDVFALSSERAMQAYVSSARLTSELMFSAAANGRAAHAAEISLMWVLRRKAIIIDTLTRFRASQILSESDPAVKKLAERLRFVRQQISNLPLSPEPGRSNDELSRVLAGLNDENDHLEETLSRSLSQFLPEQRLVAPVNVDAVRQRLPTNGALIEFTRARVFDFKTSGSRKGWYPAHYYAFVVTPRQGSPVRLLDLGEAARIDEAIKTVRANFLEFEADWVKGKYSGSDPLKSEEFAERNFREASRALYDLIYAPWRKQLDLSIKVLYVAPDDQLNLVPFEALVNDGAQYVLESDRITYLSSGRDLLRTSTMLGDGTVIFADPDFNMNAEARARRARVILANVVGRSERKTGDNQGPLQSITGTESQRLSVEVQNSSRQVRGGSWDRLIDSSLEAETIERELQGTDYATHGGVKIFIRMDALEEVLKRVRSPRILHLSTHGFFPNESREGESGGEMVDLSTGNIAIVGQKLLQRAGNPLLASGIVLSGANKIGEQRAAGVDDGWVTAEEISLMNLQGTELVVLSACGTGLGAVSAGEGVYGLRRAFQNAGAQSIVSTLFEVPSAESRELMGIFYEGLKGRKSKLDALHEAKVQMMSTRKKNRGATHPFFWAGFVLTGDPG